MRLLLISHFVIFALLFSEEATACQPSYHHWLDIDNYYQYEDQAKKNFLYKDNLFVAVVNTKKKSSEPAENNYKNRRNDASGRLDKMRLKMVELIKGKPPQTFVVPRMMKDEVAQEIEYLTKAKDMFDFWDGFQFSYASSDWYGMESMCAPIGDLTLKNKQHYLVIGYGDEVVFTEPVSGPDDPFVRSVANILEDNENNPLKVRPSYFFSNMNGFQSVKIRQCPDLKDGLRWVPSFGIELPSTDEMFDYHDNHSFIEDLETGNFLESAKCKIGDEYLIIERPFKYQKRDRGSALDMPKHRFLKITNGTINVDDIPTNYEFTGEKIIPVEQVKAWIRKGLEASSAIED